MPARRHSARATAFALAIGANGLLLALLLASHDRAAPPYQRIAAMIWIDPVPARPPPPRPPVARRPARSDSPAAPTPMPLAPPVAVVPLSPLPGDTSIDVPQIDWREEAANIVQEYLRREQQLAARRALLDSTPEVMVLPKDRGPEQGRVLRNEGGVVMHAEGDCVTTSNPQAMQPWSLDPVERAMGGSASARAFSRSGGCRADQTSRDRAAALEKAVKPRYLGGKRPPPPEEETASGIKIP